MTDCRVCLKPLATWPMGAKNGFAFNACKACGSVMTEPFPTRAMLDEFFAELNPQPSYIPNPPAEIAHIKRRLSKATDKRGGKFLDISCRHGYAVTAAREMGFTAHGIDIHPFFVKFAQKQQGAEYFTQATAQSYAETGTKADLILSVQSFCENPDIEAHTAALAKLLNAGGQIYMEEPDGNSLWLPSSFDRWAFAAPPLNFIYISYGGMQQLLARHGLKVAHKFFTWGPFMRLVVSK